VSADGSVPDMVKVSDKGVQLRQSS